jgi:hypothetical protein
LRLRKPADLPYLTHCDSNPTTDIVRPSHETRTSTATINCHGITALKLPEPNLPSPTTEPSQGPNLTTTMAWSHHPSTLTLIWMAISLPLVIWDTGYVLLRPYSMPGGSLHDPIWSPYELYGRVDHMYGFKQWEAGNGFTAAQGALNAIETAMYLYYTAAVLANGRNKALGGRYGATVLIVGLMAAVMTVSKTILYCES